MEKHNYWGKTYYWECCAWELGVTALCFDVGEDINYGFAGEYNSSAESSATGFTMWTLHKHKQVEIPRSDIG